MALILLGNGNVSKILNTTNSAIIAGGIGKVVLTLNGNQDLISLGNGNDTLTGMGNNDTFLLGNGLDILTFIGNNDSVIVGNGNDSLTLTGLNETIIAGNGKDTLSINGVGTGVIGTINTIIAGNGNDTITISGTSYYDNIVTGTGNNTITITGTSHQHTVFTAKGNFINHDIINILSPGTNDIVSAGDGGNYIFDAGTGNIVKSGAGNDTLVYNAANLLEDGGGGFNTLLVTGHQNAPIDLTPTNTPFHNFQFIDLTNGMSNLAGFTNTLDLSVNAVNQLAGTVVNPFNGHIETLVVMVGHTDMVTIGSGWTNVTPVNESPLHASENLLTVVGGVQTFTPTPVTMTTYQVYTSGLDTLILNASAPTLFVNQVQNAVNEGLEGGVLIATLTPHDGIIGAPHTYNISGSNASDFMISNDKLYLATNLTLDEETTPSITANVSVSDAFGTSVGSAVTVTVNELPGFSTPVTIVSSVNTGAALTAIDLSKVFTDQDTFDGGTITYGATGLPTWLSLNTSTGLITGTAPFLSASQTDPITVTATDSDGHSAMESFNLNVTFVDHAPTLSVTSVLTTVNEGVVAADTVLANLVVTDPDIGDTHTYQILNNGVADSRFVITNDQVILTKGSTVDEEDPAINLQIKATDSHGMSSAASTLPITVNELSGVSLVNQTADQTVNAGAAIAIDASTAFSSQDTFDGNIVSYQVTENGNVVPWLSIDSTGHITGTAPSSAEKDSINVTATDAEGRTATDSFTLNINGSITTNYATTDTAATAPDGQIETVNGQLDNPNGDFSSFVTNYLEFFQPGQQIPNGNITPISTIQQFSYDASQLFNLHGLDPSLVTYSLSQVTQPLIDDGLSIDNSGLITANLVLAGTFNDVLVTATGPGAITTTAHLNLTIDPLSYNVTESSAIPGTFQFFNDQLNVFLGEISFVYGDSTGWLGTNYFTDPTTGNPFGYAQSLDGNLLIMNPNGSFVYDITNPINNATDQFSYQLFDGQTSTISFNVNDTAPIATPDSYTYTYDQATSGSNAFTVQIGLTEPAELVPGVVNGIASSLNGVLSNDTYGGGNQFYVNDLIAYAHPGDASPSLIEPGTMGYTADGNEIILNSDGSFTFVQTQPFQQSSEQESFQYTINDGLVTSAPAAVTLNIVDQLTPSIHDIGGVLPDQTNTINLNLMPSTTAAWTIDLGASSIPEHITYTLSAPSGDTADANLIGTEVTINQNTGQLLWNNSQDAGVDPSGIVHLQITATDTVSGNTSAVQAVNLDLSDIVLNPNPQAPQPGEVPLGLNEYTLQNFDIYGQPYAYPPTSSYSYDASQLFIPVNGTYAGGAATYSATGLPNGLSIDPNTGIISGLTDAPGSFNVQITAGDGEPGVAVANLPLTINPLTFGSGSDTNLIESIFAPPPLILDQLALPPGVFVTSVSIDGIPGSPGILPDSFYPPNFFENLVTAPDGATLGINFLDGFFEYTPLFGPINGSDTFIYTLSDGTVSTMTFNVTDTPPVAVADTYTYTYTLGSDPFTVGGSGVPAGLVASVGTSSISGVLGNDNGGGAPLYVTSVNGISFFNSLDVLTADGDLTMYSNGAFTYTQTQPMTNATEAYSFQYTTSDGLLSSSSTLNLTLIDNITPIIQDVGGNSPSSPGTPININVIENTIKTWQVDLANTAPYDTFSYAIQAPSGDTFDANLISSNTISIDPNSGLITLDQPLEANAVPGGIIQLQVTATDLLSGNISSVQDVSLTLQGDITTVNPSNIFTQMPNESVGLATGTGASTYTPTQPYNYATSTLFTPAIAGGYTIPLNYSATGLPDGLSIDPSTGIISGLSDQAGTFTVHVTAQDADSPSASSPGNDAVTANLSLTVNPLSFNLWGTTTSFTGYLALPNGVSGPGATTINFLNHSSLEEDANGKFIFQNGVAPQNGTQTYSFNYTLTDGATSIISFTVTDKPIITGFNDIPFSVFVPIGPQYFVDENALGSWQTNLAATPGYSTTYTYSLTDPSNSGFLQDFSINSSTGLISQITPISDNASGYVSLIGIPLAVTVTDNTSQQSTSTLLSIGISDSDLDNGVNNFAPSASTSETILMNPIIYTQTHPFGDDRYTILKSVIQYSSNPSLDFDLTNSFAAGIYYVQLPGPLPGTFTPIDIGQAQFSQTHLLNAGTYNLQVTLADSEGDTIVTPFTLTVLKDPNAIVAKSGTQSITAFSDLVYGDSTLSSLNNVSNLFTSDNPTYVDYQIGSSSSLANSGLALDQVTGNIYGAPTFTGSRTIVVDAYYNTGEGYGANNLGSDPAVKGTLTINVVNPEIHGTLNENSPFFFNDALINGINGFVQAFNSTTQSNLSNDPISFSLASGSPGQILNYFDGNYGYLDVSSNGDAFNLLSSSITINGSLNINNSASIPFSLSISPPLESFNLSIFEGLSPSNTNGSSGGTGQSGGNAFTNSLLESTPGGTGGAGSNGGQFLLSDTASPNSFDPLNSVYIQLISVGSAGNGGQGGRGGNGDNGDPFGENGAPGGAGGIGGNGGSVIYTYNADILSTDQVIMGGNTGNAGLGGSVGSSGSQGQPGNFLGINVSSGGDGGLGGSGGDGGNVQYLIDAGSGNDYIVLGQAGYGEGGGFRNIGNPVSGNDGSVVYIVNGGSGHDYFVIDKLPSTGPSLSTTEVNIAGGTGDDVFDLQVAYFVNDGNIGTLNGSYGTLNIKGGTGFNSLILDGPNADLGTEGLIISGLGFLNNPNEVYNHITNMNLIDLKGSANITITAAEIDAITKTDSSGNHSLYITSDSGTDGLGNSLSTVHLGFIPSGSQGTTSLNHVNYNIYNLDAHTILYVQHNVHVIV